MKIKVMSNYNLPLALLLYDEKSRSMKTQRRLGLITEQEWADYIMDETTLWNIMQKTRQ